MLLVQQQNRLLNMRLAENIDGETIACKHTECGISQCASLRPGTFRTRHSNHLPRGNVRLGILRKANTLVLSDPGKIVGDPAMRAIIALGEDVVPLTLRDLREKPSLSVWASTVQTLFP